MDVQGLTIPSFAKSQGAEASSRELRRRSRARHPHFAVARSRGFDAESTLTAMDIEGIDVAVMYGTRGRQILCHDDLEPGYAAALARAYNNWAYDYCKYDPQRLKFAAQIAMHDVKSAVEEARRCVKELGAVAVMVPTYVQSGMDLGQPEFDPIYAEAQELGVPIGFHATAQVSQGNWRFHKYLGVHMTSHPFEQMLTIVAIISNGVLDRFPKLKVAFLEAGVGWLPYWMERFDEKYLRRKSEMEPLNMLPSEYVKNNRCYFTCEGEESALPLVIEQFGDQCMMYASDYPHWDMEWPHSVSQVVRRKDISNGTKQRILADNAKNFYRFA